MEQQRPLAMVRRGGVQQAHEQTNKQASKQAESSGTDLQAQTPQVVLREKGKSKLVHGMHKFVYTHTYMYLLDLTFFWCLLSTNNQV